MLAQEGHFERAGRSIPARAVSRLWLGPASGGPAAGLVTHPLLHGDRYLAAHDAAVRPHGLRVGGRLNAVAGLCGVVGL